MSPGSWLRLLAANRWQVDWKLTPVAAGIALYTLPVAMAGALSSLLTWRKVRDASISPPPIFIVGHWRSGTTLLHELMALDPRHGFPTTYACMIPSAFLITAGLARKYLSFVLTEKRPMDNMANGMDRPQEDEFALCNLGLPSPYQTIVFPNCPPRCQEYLTFDGITPAELDHWKKGFHWFLRAVSVSMPGKRLVLKSPTHTGRIQTLLQMFPDAQFIHIVRDPYVVFPSTVHLWKTTYREQGMQAPNYDGLEDYVLDTLNRMYQAFERDRELIPAGHFHEMKYEDLVRDPVGEMRTTYERLGIDGFDAVVPRLKDYLSANDGYQTNRYELTDQQRQQISTRWRSFIERYGY